MKLFQTKFQCMREKPITISNPYGFPSDRYPNSADYGYHDFFELEFFEKGEGLHYINGTAYPVTPGYVYLLFPGDYHRMQLDTEQEYSLWNLKIDVSVPRKELIDALAGVPRPISTYALDKSEFLLNELQFLHDCIHEKTWNEEMAVNSAERVLTIVKYLLEKGDRVDRRTSQTPYWAVIEYIEKNYMKCVCAADLAKLINVSEHYIGIYFKKHTGMTWSHFLLQTRLFHASQLLRETVLSVKEIAAQTGFCSPEYFARMFKSVFGVSPVEYRKQRVL